MLQMSRTQKLGYGLGAFGKDLVYGLVATFIMFYFTDVVGLTPFFLGIMFFATRIWDAVNDPMMGWIVDNTRHPMGKFRLWLLVGTLVNAVILVVLFLNPQLPVRATYVYATLAYLLWGMSYTIMDIPYWAMIPALTSDAREREQLSVIPRVFASVGFFIVSALGLKFVNTVADTHLDGGALSNALRSLLPHLEGQALGFFLLSVVVALVFIVMLAITIASVRVKDVRSMQTTSLRELWTVLAKNDQTQVVIITMILFNTVVYLTNGLGLYFFKYNLGQEELFNTFVAVVGVAQVAAMLVFAPLGKVLSRKQIFALSVILPIIGDLLLFVLSAVLPESRVLLMACGVVLFFGLGLNQVLSTVMLADSVDYGLWKLGRRNDGIIFSMQPFVVKFSSAFSALITGVGLSLVGFEANQVQSVATLFGIRIMMFILPIAGLLFSWRIYRKYFKLDREFFAKIQADLQERAVD